MLTNNDSYKYYPFVQEEETPKKYYYLPTKGYYYATKLQERKYFDTYEEAINFAFKMKEYFTTYYLQDAEKFIAGVDVIK